MTSHRLRRTLAISVITLGALLALTFPPRQDPAYAQQARDKQARAEIAGISRQPSEAARDVLLHPDDTVILLLDHQTGLFQTVKDVPVAELRNNTIALTKIAQLAGIPVITTASEPNGPNGPLMEELQNLPNATYVPRKGEVSAWDNADFVKAVEATGRKTLVIAGVWTSVCVNFPALQAKADGYKVYIVTDASGDPSMMASQTTLSRAVQAGIIPVSTNVVLCEAQRTWNRPDAAQWGEIYALLVPNYRAAIESYQRAQEAAKQTPQKEENKAKPQPPARKQ
ncbi:MAG: isochorismatase family protein [Desulfuromonadales bacterium]|nr:isochorismatase family protein [Desulfuromonadales bacterium]